MTKLKHPNIKGLIKEVPNEAVADWVAAGWIDPAAKKPKESTPKAEINSPATRENTTKEPNR
jgi:hypothetical protein